MPTPPQSSPGSGRHRSAEAAVTIGIDIGTSAVKAIAADSSGRVVARARLPQRAIVPSAGRLEHDALAAWWEAPRQVLAQLVASLDARRRAVPMVTSVAICAFVPSVVPVDGEGHPRARGILYGDERGRRETSTAQPDPTRSEETAELIRWAADHDPGAAGYWPAQAVANRSLGGPGSVDLSTAISSGPLFGADGWDPLRCARMGVDPGQLPGVELFGTAIGEVGAAGKPGGASEGGTAQGSILVAGGVDALCEQLVAGELDVGDVLVVCGSTLVVWVITDEAPDGRSAEGLWVLPDLTPGRFLVGGPSNAGGLFLDWVDHVVRPSDDSVVDPGSVPLWQPYLRGERVPLHDADLRGAVSGLDLTHGPRQLRRGAFEASAMALRRIVERAGGRPSRIVATGGGCRVQPWLQAIADVTATPVEPVAVPEGAALGAAWLARMGAGLETSTADACRWAASGAIVAPEPSWVEPCAERYGRHLGIAGLDGRGWLQ